MNTDNVTQGLLLEGLPYSLIQRLIDEAMQDGQAESQAHGIRLINTNSGMPAEFRVERIKTASDVMVGDVIETRDSRTGEYVLRGEVIEIRPVEDTHTVFVYGWGDEIIRNDNIVHINA